MTTPSTSMPTAPQPAAGQRALRADARRNRQLLVAAAAAAFVARGADASLDDIARGAGVGSGTLYRHFPNRQALLEAVFRDQVEVLCAQGQELLASPSPGEALAAWLQAFAAYATTKRGLAALLASYDKNPEFASWCRDALFSAGTALLARAQRAGAVRPDVTIGDVLRLVSAIALSGERAPLGPEQADRLLALVIDGLRYQPPTGR